MIMRMCIDAGILLLRSVTTEVLWRYDLSATRKYEVGDICKIQIQEERENNDKQVLFLSSMSLSAMNQTVPCSSSWGVRQDLSWRSSRLSNHVEYIVLAREAMMMIYQ